MAGYYAHIVKRTSSETNSCFEEGDTTSLAVGWTHGCLRCAQKRAVTADNLELHIECLEDELQAARELLEEMKELVRVPGHSKYQLPGSITLRVNGSGVGSERCA